MKELLNILKGRYIDLKALINNYYLNFLSGIIFFLGSKKINLLIKNNKNINNLEDLTPYISEKEEENYNLQTYLESLEWGILNQNVKNIAVSGSFGTGKSTILNLFKKKNPEFKVLDINLGKFEEKNKQTEVDIETSIVQQILYFEKKKNLRDSRFERINYDKFIFFKVVFFIFWVFSILYLFFDKIYEKVYFINKSETSYYIYLMKFTFIIGVFFIAKKLFRQIFKLKVSKISFSDAEFVPKENDISIINKHVDELIYFFEKTKTSVVFIEDIDRFEDAVEVFIKLRELNIIINNSKDILQKVTFVYAVKDELFSKNNEKTKFFDLIIPIIPVVDYSNSNTQFIKRLKSDFIDKNILIEDIIYNISPFINDMRSLINIINEFKTYYKIKNKENDKIDFNKLFSLIVLKNIYPIDFKDLQNKVGFVYEIFDKKNEFYKETETNLIIELGFLRADKENIASERQQNIIELRRIYISEISIQTFGATHYYLENENVMLNEFIKDEIFTKIVENGKLSYTKDYKSKSLDFTEIENVIDSKTNYRDRERRILDKQNDKIISIDSEIKNIQNKLSNLKNSSLNDLIIEAGNEETEKYFSKAIKNIAERVVENSKDEFKDDIDKQKSIDSVISKLTQNYNLLKVLIINGYLDENYSTYISLFYPESITEKDNDLKVRIIGNNETFFDEKIDRPKNFIAEIVVDNFKKESILNFYILDYLIKNYRNNKIVENKFNEFIKTISNTKDKSVDFINRYIIYSRDEGKDYVFINSFSSQWDGFWELIYIKDEFNLEEKKRIFDILFKNSNVQKLKSLNKTEKIKNFLVDYEDFVLRNFNSEDKTEVFNKLKSLGIMFNKIEYKTHLHDWIYQIMTNNLYQINKSNISLFLEKYDGNKIDSSTSISPSYSFINKSDCTSLKENIEENINEYIERVLLHLDGGNEEGASIEKLLNSNNVKEENKYLIIENLNFKLLSISKINDNMYWGSLMILERVEANWENVLLYYKMGAGIDDVLTDFLNDSYNDLKLHCIDEPLKDTDDEISLELINRFNVDLVNSKILDVTFSNLVSSMTMNFEEVSIIDRIDRISALIEHNIILLNSYNLSSLSVENIHLLCTRNEQTLSELYPSLEIPIESWGEIFNSNISGNLKIDILKFLTEQEMYDYNDIKFLEIIIENFKATHFHISLEYFIENVLLSVIEIKEKVYLLNLERNNIDSLNMKTYLENLGEPYSKILQKEKIEIENSNENEVLMRSLKDLGFIKRTYLKNNDTIITVSF
ncbi:hypothetical protein ACN9MN_14925 [Chryseobacterium sp. S-02]|uniref:YobI family P-loop NTPase n=1 Tax=Chryseobacterium sp. S-02 TaxID=3404064 RepID=UPI003CE89F31